MFKNSPSIPDLLFEMSKFQHHTKECSKCSISLVPPHPLPLNLSQIFWWQQSSYGMVLFTFFLKRMDCFASGGYWLEKTKPVVDSFFFRKEKKLS